MARSRNPNREKAFELFKEHQGKITAKEIASLLDEKEKNIEYWKTADDWNRKYNPKGGAPLGNKNALGNNGGAPNENQNARKEGWYSKYYPTKVRNLIKEAEAAGGTPLEILWAQIMTQWIAIVRAQEIMYVDNKDDITKELKKVVSSSKMDSEEYEIQFAWDKHANFLNAQSRAMAQLTNMIKKYDDMLHNNWDMATEEQKLRLEKLKVQINNPELQHRKIVTEEKLTLEKQRFEHQKKIDELKNF